MGRPLRTYGLTIAYLGLFVYSVGTICLIVLLYLLTSNSEKEYIDGVNRHDISYFWVLLPLMLLGLLVSVLMLYGIHKNRAGFLMAWLIVCGFFFICHTIFLIWLLGLWLKSKPYLGSIVGHLMMYALAATVWLGIYLLYKQIDEENRDDEDDDGEESYYD